MSVVRKKNLLFCTAVGTGFSLALTAALLLAAAWAVNSGLLRQADAEKLRIPCVLLSVFVPALILAKKRGKNYMACSLLIAAGYIVVSLLVYAVGSIKMDIPIWFMQIFAVAAAAGLLSGLLGAGQSYGRKRPSKGRR